MVSGGSLGTGLMQLARHIEAEARGAGLDSYEVVFEMLDARDVNAVAAYAGFPLRYPSWRFGMEYERLQKGYQYGLSKIYELVINNDPTVAYLVRSNSLMEQKLVMAHVFGHADFFKHNVWFEPTDRHMVDVMGRHASRIRDMIDALGMDKVERFLDVALSLDTLVDPYLPHRASLSKARRPESRVAHSERARLSFEAAFESTHQRQPPEPRAEGVVPPTYDVLGYLADHAPLEPWQADLLRMVRAEAYYFAPQRMTKIMNEGWASYWHSRLLTSGILEPSEIVEFADCHSGATLAAPGQINPYKLGIELFRHAAAAGRDVFFLRRVHNDVSFIDDLVDEEFAVRHQLFVYQKNTRTGKNEVADRDWRHIKEELLRSLTWGGLPQIELAAVEKGEELLFAHHHDGRDIKLDEAGELLRQIALLWKRPVHLLTLEEDQGRRLTSDGKEIRAVESAQAETLCKTAGSAGERKG